MVTLACLKKTLFVCTLLIPYQSAAQGTFVLLWVLFVGMARRKGEKWQLVGMASDGKSSRYIYHLV